MIYDGIRTHREDIGAFLLSDVFQRKIQTGRIDARYNLYPLDNIDLLPALISSHPGLAGLNVTIPYKVDVMKYLDSLSEEAEAIGAVNVIRINREGGRINLKGFNSDAYGFSESLRECWKKRESNRRDTPTRQTLLYSVPEGLRKLSYGLCGIWGSRHSS